jgi:hypothetical protein
MPASMLHPLMMLQNCALQTAVQASKPCFVTTGGPPALFGKVHAAVLVDVAAQQLD